MAAKEKEINRKKGSIADIVLKLAKALSTLSQLQKITEDLKQRLRRHSRSRFLRDLKEGNINGNHVYNSEHGPVTVNFRVTPNADISQYESSLATEFEENWEKMFDEIEEIEVTASDKKIAKHFEDHPELFYLSIKPRVTMIQLHRLYKDHPKLFDINVRSKKRYKEVYPEYVEESKKIYPKNGFIERLGKVDDSLRKRVLNCLYKFFENNLEMSVKY